MVNNYAPMEIALLLNRHGKIYVQRELGFSKYYNHGVGGRRLMAMATDECLAEITEDFDVILVMGGNK